MLANIGEDILTAVLQGAPPGTVYALVALGFVLAYKTSGVFNLAFGAQAYASAVLYYKAHAEWGWPILPAFVVSVVVLAPLIGFLLESLIFRHLRTASPVSSLVVALGLTIAIPSVVDLALDFQPRNGQIHLGIVPRGNSVYYEVFGLYSFSRDELMAMAVATAAMLGLVALFRFTMVGLRMPPWWRNPRMTRATASPPIASPSPRGCCPPCSPALPGAHSPALPCRRPLLRHRGGGHRRRRGEHW
jgi:branched-subunit amino acid ABC-type transport system permease component